MPRGFNYSPGDEASAPLRRVSGMPAVSSPQTRPARAVDKPSDPAAPSHWSRYSLVFTSAALDSGVAIGCRIAILCGTSAGLTIEMDQVMETHGSSPYVYADGNSPGWIWNGAPNASTSTGPAL